MYFDLEIELFFLSQTISILSHLEIQKKKKQLFYEYNFSSFNQKDIPH